MGELVVVLGGSGRRARVSAFLGGLFLMKERVVGFAYELRWLFQRLLLLLLLFLL